MAKILGIDLGTTFSAMATLDETGRPSILHNKDGANITPSVVQFSDADHVYVGEEARKDLGRDPQTFGRFKRHIGTSQSWEIGEQQVTPTGLSSLVLKKLKDDAEQQIGAIDYAVVTTPANFANEAREATLDAARKAGLPIQYIVNEPTAAALYYAYKAHGDLSGTYAVYDMGGGTFDVTLLRATGDDIEVLATDGVSRLGGDDFDQALWDLVCKRYEQEHNVTLEEEDFSKSDAEDAKKALSKKEGTLVVVRGSGGRSNIRVTRAEFEEAISPWVTQAEMLCEGVLDEVGIDKTDIKEVFLVGGSTRIPCVRESVKRTFDREPTTSANVDEVVALGASLYAAYKADRSKLTGIQRSTVERMNVAEVTSKCFGILTLEEGGSRGSPNTVNSVLIEKNAKIPASVSDSFYTVQDGQTHVNCRITEANAHETDPRFVKVIWEGKLGPFPDGRPAGQEISVTYSYDANQVMRCKFKDVASGVEENVDLDMTHAKRGNADHVEKFLVE